MRKYFTNGNMLADHTIIIIRDLSFIPQGFILRSQSIKLEILCNQKIGLN
jgi:hypothetical protein